MEQDWDSLAGLLEEIKRDHPYSDNGIEMKTQCERAGELVQQASSLHTDIIAAQEKENPKYAEMGFTTSMAEPLTGTTYTHAVALLTKDEKAAKEFFADVAQAREVGAMKVVGSNGRVMRAVKDSANKVAFGLTDTDDAWIAIREGKPVKVVYPDQGDGQPGAVLIPNTVALVRGRPNPAADPRATAMLRCHLCLSV